MILSCKNINKSFGADIVLEDITFLIEEGEKAAIVGINGAGKTTLLKIVTGELQHDGGEVIFKKGCSIGYLSQMKDLNLDNTIHDELLTVFDALINMESEIRKLENEMSFLQGEELDKVMERYGRLNILFEEQNGYEYKSRVRGVIKGLGFSDDEYNKPLSYLSGGQKTRVSLGKLLLTSPDLLLLDEPTNHLDIESVNWLEDNFLKNYPGSVLVISHDRYFLDKTVSKIIEIENGKSKNYNGTYTYYALKKEVDREIAIKHYLDQQKEIKRQQEIIKQLRSFNREKSIKRAESREKMLAKMEKVERPENAPPKMHIILEPSITSGNDVLHVENLSKSFDGQEPLFRNVSFDITRGEIVALIGANGIGKTTLFRMITDMLGYDSGMIRLGTNVKVNYYDQEYALLDEQKTIFQEISDAYPKLKNVEIRNALAAFVFTGDDVFKEISTLSGGEKGRVALAKLMLSNANFLLLDEPTNHLDMFSKEILEEALRNYTGTVFYISHDRYFINNTADKVLELTSAGVSQYLGNYDYYIEKKSENKIPDLSQTQWENDAGTDSKSNWKQKKVKQSGERKLASRVQKLEKEIHIIEEKIKQCDNKLESEDVYSDHKKLMVCYEEKKALEKRLEELYLEWEEAQTEVL